MVDFITKDKRSNIMKNIRSKNTKLEIKFRKELWQKGLRGYRIYYKLPGKPDVVFTKYKLAIFIDGDFWHGYNWKVRGKIPPNKQWQDKIQKNIDRDKKIDEKLRESSWVVIRFWEHEINENIDECLNIVKINIIKAKTAQTP